MFYLIVHILLLSTPVFVWLVHLFHILPVIAGKNLIKSFYLITRSMSERLLCSPYPLRAVDTLSSLMDLCSHFLPIFTSLPVLHGTFVFPYMTSSSVFSLSPICPSHLPPGKWSQSHACALVGCWGREIYCLLWDGGRWWENQVLKAGWHHATE